MGLITKQLGASLNILDLLMRLYSRTGTNHRLLRHTLLQVGG